MLLQITSRRATNQIQQPQPEGIDSNAIQDAYYIRSYSNSPLLVQILQ